jgi:hypothetical protein
MLQNEHLNFLISVCSDACFCTAIMAFVVSFFFWIFLELLSIYKIGLVLLELAVDLRSSEMLALMR